MEFGSYSNQLNRDQTIKRPLQKKIDQIRFKSRRHIMLNKGILSPEKTCISSILSEEFMDLQTLLFLNCVTRYLL